MNSARLFLATWAASVVVGLAWAEPPVVTQVEPKAGFNNEATPITIHGAGFEPQTHLALLSGGPVTIDTSGFARDVVVSGKFAFVADGDLQIIDISNPAAPVLVKTFETPHTWKYGDGADAVAISGQYLFVAGGSYHDGPYLGWLYVLDVSDPKAPQQTGLFQLDENYFGGVAVSGNFAYLTDSDSGLTIIDVNDPTEPRLAGNIPVDGAIDVAISGSFAFLAAGEEGLQVVDVSNPSLPSVVSRLDTNDIAHDVAVVGPRAFVADENTGLITIDITDPLAPSILSIFDTPSSAMSVTVSGDFAFVADSQAGLQVVDVRNPVDPLLFTHCNSTKQAFGLAVSGSYVFLAGGYSGLLITTGACSQAFIGRYEELPDPREVGVEGNHAFVLGMDFDEYAGYLDVIDFSNPKTLAVSGQLLFPESWYPTSIAFSGDLAYVTFFYNGLKILDISDPASPSIIGGLDADYDEVRDVAVAGTYAYIATGSSNGLRIIDVSDPSAPFSLSHIRTWGTAEGVAVQNSLAYVADGYSGLQILDVSDPADPKTLGRIELDGFARRVRVSGNYGFIADGDWGLAIIDISNPAAPRLAGHYDTPDDVFDLEISGNLVFVTDKLEGLLVFDVTDPTNPVLVSRYETTGDADHLAVSGDLAFVVGEDTGLQIFRLNPPLENVAWTSGETMTAKVPSGFAQGAYDLRATNQEPDATLFPNAFLACMRRDFNVALLPWFPPLHHGTPMPIEASPVTWRLEVGGDEELVCPQPSHRADLLLPLLPGNLEIRHEPAEEPGIIRVELLISRDENSGLVRLLADDPIQADALWAKISANGRIAVPRNDARNYAELTLGVVRKSSIDTLPSSDVSSPAPSPSGFRSVRPRPAPIPIHATFDRYEYRFRGTGLIEAGALGRDVDLVFEVTGRDRIGCESHRSVSYFETVGTNRSWVIGGDLDDDSVQDFLDNCPVDPNPGQEDADGDGWGDLCDNCATDPDPDQVDTDHDGLGDRCDSCTSVMNACQTDFDGDGPGDECDNCPRKTNADQADADGDRVGDVCDNCPATGNPDQADFDNDRVGDTCDPCTDRDHDGWGNPGFPVSTCSLDNCPRMWNPDQADRIHPNGIGDACDDPDGDGAFDLHDNCPDLSNTTQDDADRDNIGDICDSCTDTDSDGFGNPGFPVSTCPLDNCPDNTNPGQEDWDGDGPGNACDVCTDTDGDGFANPGFPASQCPVDNCPSVTNLDQSNRDKDALGDICDPFPDHALRVVSVAPKYALNNQMIPVTFRLERKDTGALVTDLSGVRTTITLSGSATFGETVGAGKMINSGGTNRALVEFVGGLATLEVRDTQPEIVIMRGEDTEANDAVLAGGILADFEADNGGFTHSGTNDPWQWGPPTSGPRRAHSGMNVWATNLSGNYPDSCSAALYSPVVRLGSASFLRFWHAYYFQDYYDRGSVQISSDGGRTWTDLRTYTDFQYYYYSSSRSLSSYAGKDVQIRFLMASNAGENHYGWYIDDVNLWDPSQSIDILAPDEDSDGDGLSNAGELKAGLDPRDSDTDDDGAIDGSDNCPLLKNPDQADRVHPNGIGDACDDPDGDHVFDDKDNCPNVPNANQSNRDGDRLGDACDPYPDHNLLIKPVGPKIVLIGEPLSMTFRLERPKTGELVTDLTGVRTTLTLSGSATFGTTATAGILVAGGGTNRALVEFVNGLVTLDIQDLSPEIVYLGSDDTEANDIAIFDEFVTNFEENEGGFSHSGTNDSWQWGQITSIPWNAHSGTKVWGTNLAGYYPANSSASLFSPPFQTSAKPTLEFWHWVEINYGNDTCKVQLSQDGGMTWYTLGTFYDTTGWEKKSFDISAYAGREIKVRFLLTGGSYNFDYGWYVDDFTIRGLAKTIYFLEGDGDADSDGMNNAAEMAAGLDPLDPDFDNDGLLDGNDNCPAIVNPDQKDLVHPNSIGDACDDPDGDGIFDLQDNCPDNGNTNQSNRDGDTLGDACDPFPDDALLVRPDIPLCGATGQIALVTYRLVRRGTGEWVTNLSGVRTTLTLSGSATFGDTATNGILIRGGGTNRALVEFVGGLVTLGVSDPVAETTILGGDDSEKNNILVLGEKIWDFEDDDGGFTHFGTNDSWEWGHPSTDPGGAHSGSRLWATNLAGIYLNDSEAALYPPIIDAGTDSSLEFWHWFDFGYDTNDRGDVEVSGDGGLTWNTLGSFYYNRIWTKQSFDLSAFAGQQIQIRFLLVSDSSNTDYGWYIDDIALRGLAFSFGFLEAAGDEDADGVINSEECAAGLDPRNSDSDGDWILDGRDNCPDVANNNQLDQVHPGGMGDACDDPDGDGVVDLGDNCPNAPNPGQEDTDQDTWGDACDNCPATYNFEQTDVVHPNGIGDVCDDPDADGVVDNHDNCPDLYNVGQENSDQDTLGDACDNCPAFTNPEQTDRDSDTIGDVCDNCPEIANSDQLNQDRDQLGDVCDPYPDRALKVTVVAPKYAVAGELSPVTYRLERVDTGELVTDLVGVRTTLTLTGSALFGENSTEGLLLDGGGTNRVFVEFVAGRVTIGIRDVTAEISHLAGEDTQKNGVTYQTDILEDFETTNGSFTHSGTADSWQWGIPTSGPRAAHSGTLVWATNVAGNYPSNSAAGLVSSTYRLAAGTTPILEFWHWVRTEACCDIGRVQVSTDGGAIWQNLAEYRGNLGGYAKQSLSLHDFLNRYIKIRFWFTSDYGTNDAGWYIDDFKIRLVKETTEFLWPTGDEDADGLTNANEIARGLDPRNRDTDNDTISDANDNCPLIENTNQKDRDEDGWGNVCDNCRTVYNPDQADSDGDGIGDACETDSP